MLKKILGCLVAVSAMGCLVVGCSDDVRRITSPATADVVLQPLTASTDLNTGQSLEDNASDGFYYPDDGAAGDDESLADPQEPLVPSTDNGGSNKPIDNGKDPD